VVVGVGVGARTTDATHLHERVTKLLRRPVVDYGIDAMPGPTQPRHPWRAGVAYVVDDGVDAGVEVSEAVPQHTHRLYVHNTSRVVRL